MGTIASQNEWIWGLLCPADLPWATWHPGLIKIELAYALLSSMVAAQKSFDFEERGWRDSQKEGETLDGDECKKIQRIAEKWVQVAVPSLTEKSLLNGGDYRSEWNDLRNIGARGDHNVLRNLVGVYTKAGTYIHSNPRHIQRTAGTLSECAARERRGGTFHFGNVPGLALTILGKHTCLFCPEHIPPPLFLPPPPLAPTHPPTRQGASKRPPMALTSSKLTASDLDRVSVS
ncbi:hypothetical protein B0H13DRAFT_1905487 [Mycena leptocephala]|nr:hypothetical protein B0H13DRAFT_1905487 [Mycena leptocephala]